MLRSENIRGERRHLTINPSELCTGCGACIAACPQSCITMENKAGFYYPTVDADRCINCGSCADVCQINRNFGSCNKQTYFIGCVSQPQPILNSSSGGVSYAISKQFLQDNGLVCGAAYSDNMCVSHIIVDRISDLIKLQGSKYVQSTLEYSYNKIVDFLREGKRVLFTGTPCQVAGLRLLVPKNLQEKLFLCDIFCGGVPSPIVFQKYVDFLQKKYKQKIHTLNFRSKKYGYRFGYLHEVQFEDGSSVVLSQSDSTYVRCIGKGFIRQSCFSCKFIGANSVSDISLGDFSGCSKNGYYGLSSIIVNTEKGAYLLDSLRNDLELIESNYEEIANAQKGAFQLIKKIPDSYSKFFEDINRLNWKEMSVEYLEDYSRKEKMINLLPTPVLAFIRNKRN